MISEENRLASKVLDCAFTVHRSLGPGLLESAYQIAMEAELDERDVTYKAQYEIPLEYKGRSLSTAYRLDLMVGEKLVVELKSVDILKNLYMAQLLTYLKLTDCKLGLILNFNTKLMKNGIKRVIL